MDDEQTTQPAPPAPVDDEFVEEPTRPMQLEDEPDDE